MVAKTASNRWIVPSEPCFSFRSLQMEQRKAHRVVFERGFSANLMAIDGTWTRPCTMQDVSDTGAKLMVEGSIKGLPLKEFFLVLSTMGKAYRRCQLAWVNGDQLGVTFIKAPDAKKKTKSPAP
jgi:hypothetical protein